MSSERFGEIRSLLHSHEPSEELWNTLTSLLWGWRTLLPQDAMAAYCNDLLSSWPDALRTVPKSWWRAILRGEHEPIFLISRALLMPNKNLTLSTYRSLMTCHTLRNLTIIDLSNNHFSQPRGDQSSWVLDLERSSFASSLHTMILREIAINAETLTALSSVDLRKVRTLDLSWNYQLLQLPDYLKSELAPSHLEHLVLRHIIEEYVPESHDEAPSSFSMSRLREPGLARILLHTSIDHLDIASCRVNPTIFLELQALKRLTALTASLDHRTEEWCEVLGHADMEMLEHLHIVRIPFGHVERLLDVLLARIEAHDTRLNTLTLTSNIITHHRFHTRDRAIMEAHHITIQKSDPGR